jgi:hypothetical protein
MQKIWSYYLSLGKIMEYDRACAPPMGVTLTDIRMESDKKYKGKLINNKILYSHFVLFTYDYDTST